MTEESNEDKIEKLEKLADEIGLDIEELIDRDREDLGVSGTFTVRVLDEEDNVKHKEEVEI